MDLFSASCSPSILSLLPLLLFSTGVLGTTFTFVNKCDYTVWPGVLPNAGSPSLDSTGFELPNESSRTFIAPTGWSARFWGRTNCNFDGSELGYCATGECGSGQVECNGAGAAPPVTLAEFTLGTGGQDFYDVSLVDGYNLPMIVEGSGGSGMCASTGCVTDLNLVCPSELKYADGEACRSACEAFGSPQYCCSGAYNSPATCKPSMYSEMFKSACPRSYSYAFDDPTSTFTCTGADYTVTFCPSTSSQKSSRDPPPTTNGGGSMSGSGTFGSESGSGTVGSESGSGTVGAGSGPVIMGSDPVSGTMSSFTGAGSTGTIGSRTGSGGGDAMLADGSYLAGLAMGDSTRNMSPSALHCTLIASLAISLLSFLYL